MSILYITNSRETDGTNNRADGMDLIDGAEQHVASIRRVDLRGVEPGCRGWEEARAAVAASMEAHGAVLVVQDALGPDLRRALFGHAVPEFFALPLDAKRSLVSGPVNGYIGPMPEAPAYESVRNVGDVLWPHGGNPAFCDAISAFAANMLGLERKVGTMVLESLGIGQGNVASHLDSLNYSVRLSHYGLSEAGAGMLMRSHRDCTVLSVVVQHEVEGLEVQTQDGSWLAVAPEPDTVAVIAGELLAVVTNGRVPACVHRVSAPSGRERFSARSSCPSPKTATWCGRWMSSSTQTTRRSTRTATSTGTSGSGSPGMGRS
ncbi:unnamed protein product [Urochloa humidicola]